MDYQDFTNSISQKHLPDGLSVYLQAMWHDAVGDRAQAHSLVDGLEDPIGCWVHAYLHRKEPNIWNADYWYRRAGKNRPDSSLDEEWETIAKTLLPKM